MSALDSRDRGIILAPFTRDQVQALNKYQRQAPMHPFTCADRDAGHTYHGERDYGLLVATADGWVCRDCEYTQGWAFAFMADPVPWHEYWSSP